MKMDDISFNVSIIDDNGIETKLGHTLVSTLKMNKPAKIYTV